MKTLVIPVDFTATSNNAVNFAAEWCKRYEYERIILLKTFYDSMFENILVSSEYTNLNEDFLNSQRRETMEKLNDLCDDLAVKAGSTVKIITAVSELPLLRSIFEIIQDENPDLIIVGSDNYSYSGGSIIAGNVIGIAKTSPVNVLVVPASYQYRPVLQALLPFNFNMLKNIDRLYNIRNYAKWHDIKLFVLNIGAGNRIIKEPGKFDEAQEKFQDLLKNFQHEIFYSADNNVITGINNFTKEHDVQLLVALPGKHSFLYNLTHQSISQAIYSNAGQPVLILK